MYKEILTSKCKHMFL